MKTTTTKSSTIKTVSRCVDCDAIEGQKHDPRCESIMNGHAMYNDVPAIVPLVAKKTPAKKTPAKKTTKPAAKKSRKHQKKTLGRTAISRRARRIRRDLLVRGAEVEFLKATPDACKPGELEAAERRLANAMEAFNSLPALAQELEVPKARAMAELKGDDEDEGEDE